ncbi:MAG: endonuclease/exonuclease/phosphatase family protein [Egibacteraceae bacterium]
MIDKAIEVIQSVKPHVLSLNEICTSDLDRLRGAMERTAPEHVEFKAAEKPPGTKRMCTDGRGEYGNAVMVSDEYAGSDHSSGIYTAQVTGEEQRVYSCLGGGRINACTTHLTVDGEGKALEQCGELMSGPASRYANSGPTIVAGDLNLRYNRHDKYHNVQKCVPDGFVRKGDEKVQHVMASSRFDFIDKRNVSMKDGKGQTTDHPALLATLVLR